MTRRSPTDDAKYAPVYTAILRRGGMAQKDREEALQGLVAINKTDTVTELLSTMQELDDGDKEQQRVGRELAVMLLKEPTEVLAGKASALQQATAAKTRVLRSAGYAGLIAAGRGDAAWNRRPTIRTMRHSISGTPCRLVADPARRELASFDCRIAWRSDSAQCPPGCDHGTGFRARRRRSEFPNRCPVCRGRPVSNRCRANVMLAVPEPTIAQTAASVQVDAVLAPASRNDASRATNDRRVCGCHAVGGSIDRYGADRRGAAFLPRPNERRPSALFGSTQLKKRCVTTCLSSPSKPDARYKSY